MSIIRHPRSLRQSAAVMLLVWLFALVSGIANACAADRSLSHHGQHAAGLELHDAHLQHSDTAHADHDEAVVGQNPDPSMNHEVCQKFCDDESGALSKLHQDVRSVPQSLPLLFASVFLAWTSGDILANMSPECDVLVPDTGHPISIRFLRLTI